MNRLVTLAGVALVFVAMFGLYKLAYRVDAREVQLRALAGQITEEKQSIAVLRAEWAYLTRPQMIQSQAVDILGMMPALPLQMIRFTDLPARQERLILVDAAGVDGEASLLAMTADGSLVPLPRRRPGALPDASPRDGVHAGKPAPGVIVQDTIPGNAAPPDVGPRDPGLPVLGPRDPGPRDPGLPVLGPSGSDPAVIAVAVRPSRSAVQRGGDRIERTPEPRLVTISATTSAAVPAAFPAAAGERGLLPADMEARLLKVAAQQRAGRRDATRPAPGGEGR